MLTSHMKHNQYHRGHSIIKDKDEASTACWHRNLKGIRYCFLICGSQILARKTNLIIIDLLEVPSEIYTQFSITIAADNGTRDQS